MESLNLKKVPKPTLRNATSVGKKLDTNFNKQIKSTGMSIKENHILNEKEESLKKKIFKLDKMETLVHTDEQLSKVFATLKQDADELYGYHWNETILNMIFNDYVLNSPKYLQKYKNTRAKPKTRRGEEGIAQLQNDIDKEKESKSGAEERKQDLLKKDAETKKDSEEKLDEWNPFGGKKMDTPAPAIERSINDLYLVDKKNNLVAVAPYKNQEQFRSVLSKYAGNPDIKKIAWFDAVSRGIKNVPREVTDGNYDKMKAEFDAKYKTQGGYQNIPALAEDVNIGMKYKISDGSGLDSNKIVTIVKPEMVKVDGNGVPTNVSGAYKPVDWKKEVAIQYEDGSIGTMFKSRLTPVVAETDGAASSGSYAAALDSHNPNEIADVTYQNETTTSSSSGQYSGKAIWAASPAKSRYANKPAWHGGKIIGESVINGDLDYMTDPSAFKKYILKNEIAQLLTEEFSNMEEGETFKQTAERVYKKLQQYAQDSPELSDEEGYKETLDIAKYEAETGKAHPKRIGATASTIPTQQVAEHHLHDRESKIQFILTKTYDDARDAAKYTEEQLDGMSDEEIDSLYQATEKELGISEQPDFDEMLKKDLKYTGHDVSDDESTEELESQDGLFKGKWDGNEPLKENANLSADKLVKWAGENILYAKSDPSQVIAQFAQDNGTTVQGLKDKAKFYASNAQLFPNAAEVKDVMLDLIAAIDDIAVVEGNGLWDNIHAKKERGEKPLTKGQEGYPDKKQWDRLTKEENELNEKAVSKKQQKFMGMVHAAQKGKLKNPSPAVEKAAESMTDKEAKDFASTKHKGLPEKKKKSVDEGIFGFGNSGGELNVDQIRSAIENFNSSQGSPEFRNQFVKAKDYIRTKAGNVARMPQLKMWLDNNMPQLSNYVGTIWGNWDLLPNNKLSENKTMMNKNEYKTIVKAMLESTGKSLKSLDNKEKKSLFENADFFYKARLTESMIDDQPDSMINNQETSIAKSMDSDELNKDGAPVGGGAAASAVGGVQEASYDTDDLKAKPSIVDKLTDYSDEESADVEEPVDEPVAKDAGVEKRGYETGDDPQVAADALKFKEMLKAKYGVDSVGELSNVERAELMKSMNFGGEKKAPEMDYSQFQTTDAQKAEFAGRDEKRLSYLAQHADSVNSVADFAKLATDFKNMSGENMHHPMAILASIQALPSDSPLRMKLSKIENVLKSNMKESVNEERKTSAILNVEKLGKENAKNFKQDLAKEDAVDQDKTYPKDDGIHKAPVYPNPKDFYIEQDLDKVQKEAKSMADIEKEMLAKTKGQALKNVGNSANEKGNEITKRNLSKEEMLAVAMNRGDGMQDIVYDNKPSEKFEKRMEKDLGEDIYKLRQDKMEYKSDAPMYNKDTQPTAGGDKKEENNKFKKGYNSESITGKYKDEFNKFKLVEFKLADVEIVETASENAFKLSLDGMGNKYSLVGKKINENVGFENIAEEYDFYLHENKVTAIKKVEKSTEPKVYNKGKVNESSFDKMKHLMNYKPNNYVDTKKSVKF